MNIQLLGGTISSKCSFQVIEISKNKKRSIGCIIVTLTDVRGITNSKPLTSTRIYKKGISVTQLKYQLDQALLNPFKNE